MYWSKYFIPTSKENPSGAKIPSHQLLIRAGMIKQESAGIYSWLPLGFKVLKNIESIVREEQEAAGAIEVLMPTLQSSDLWIESGRYEGYGEEMLRISDRHDADLIYGPTNEEQITEIFRSYIKSYKNLPLNLFHIQWKFRDEIRPRFGLLRGREFLMKDAYSFDLDKESAKISYFKMFTSYMKTFKRLGLNAIPVVADSGPIGGELSHEFSIITKTGETEVYYDSRISEIEGFDFDYSNKDALENSYNNFTKFYSSTHDKHSEDLFKKIPEEFQKKGKAIEIGHIFSFGCKYSEPMNAFVNNDKGKNVPVYMGSYGIGVSRLVSAIIEAYHDDRGILWPQSISPFQVGIINLGNNDEKCKKTSENIYQELRNNNIDVIYDDRDESAGKKYADMDLIGIPYQIILGPRDLENNKCELKNRLNDQRTNIDLDNIIKELSKLI
ncbi:MAG: proline--tRNA ligase [Rhodobiaceae bacterium]|nr:proline--tRNA ligase [Rhodobiaceae bacterium]